MESSSTLVEKVRQLGVTLMKTIKGLTVTNLAFTICHLRHVKFFTLMFSVASHAGKMLVLTL